MAKTRNNFKKHMMYSKSGEGKMANTYDEHMFLKKKGWGHTKPKRKLKGLQSAKYFIGGLISGIKGAKQSKQDIATAEADRLAQLAKEQELRDSRQKLTMSPEVEKMKEGLGGTEIQRRQESAERARAGAMAAATRGGSRVDPFAAMKAGEQQEGKLASEQARAERAGLKAGMQERGKLRQMQEDREKADYARQAQLADYAREDVMAAQSNLASYQQQQYGAIDAAIGTFASDEKEKKNIKKVGKTKSGVPVSEFEYKDKKDAPSGPGKYRGVIAQDLIGTEHEDAVTKVNKNTLGVNYGKIDVKLGKIKGGKLKDKIKRRKKYMTGGMAGHEAGMDMDAEARAEANWQERKAARKERKAEKAWEQGKEGKALRKEQKADKARDRQAEAEEWGGGGDSGMGDDSYASISEARDGAKVPAGQPDVTPGKFSHETNPIDLIQKDGANGQPEKIGEMTGGEAIVPPKNVTQIRKMIKADDGKALVKLMDRLLTRWDKEAAEDEEARAEFGKTMKAKHGHVIKPRIPSGKQKFKFRKQGRTSIGRL